MREKKTAVDDLMTESVSWHVEQSVIMDAHANVAPMTEREIADLGKKLNDGATADWLAAPDTLRDSFDPRIVYTRAHKCTYRSANNDNAIWKYASVGGAQTFLLKTGVSVQRGHIEHVELEGMPVLVPHKWLRVASDKSVATVLIANGKRVWSAVCMLAAVCDIRRLLRCCPSDTKIGMQIMRASMRAVAQLVENDVMQHDFKWENCAMITGATGEHRFCVIDTASVRRMASDARVKHTYVRPRATISGDRRDRANDERPRFCVALRDSAAAAVRCRSIRGCHAIISSVVRLGRSPAWRRSHRTLRDHSRSRAAQRPKWRNFQHGDAFFYTGEDR